MVFMKGCPLSCRWCSNPESQSPQTELCYRTERCLGSSICGECLTACTQEAISPAAEDAEPVKLQRSRCNSCGECATVCPSKAFSLWGKLYSVDQVFNEVAQDQDFYHRSGGGLTVGGGDPIMQHEFVSTLLRKARKYGMDTAIETAGHGPYEHLKAMAEYANQLFYDVKHLDPKMHQRSTGVHNQLILKNLRTICAEMPRLKKVIRTPLVPDFNDSPDLIRGIASLARELAGVEAYELLPYHAFGEAKYRQLNREYPCAGLRAISSQRVAELQAQADEVMAS